MLNLLKDGSFMGFGLVYLFIGSLVLASGALVAIAAMVLFRTEIAMALDPTFTRVIIVLLTSIPFVAILTVLKVFKRSPPTLPSVLIDDSPVEVSYRNVPEGRLLTEKGDF